MPFLLGLTGRGKSYSESADEEERDKDVMTDLVFAFSDVFSMLFCLCGLGKKKKKGCPLVLTEAAEGNRC